MRYHFRLRNTSNNTHCQLSHCEPWTVQEVKLSSPTNCSQFSAFIVKVYIHNFLLRKELKKCKCLCVCQAYYALKVF